MTPAKPGMHTELIEPLREFLGTFTQELTEQQFIPAFRDELRRLLSSLKRIEESGDTLQQIAVGVERLREVFAPSGTKMLEGVKELEGLMRDSANGLKKQSEDVLADLLKTHTELEGALRQEAGVLQEQTSVGRETLERAAGEIEDRLAALTEQIDGLCRKTEAEVAQLADVSQQAVNNAATPAAAESSATPSGAVATVELTEDLKTLFSKTESVVAEELSRYQGEIRESLQANNKDNSDRLARIDKTIEEALKSVGPRVQEELDSALERLRDQIQTLASVEAEVRRSKDEHEHEQQEQTTVSDSALKSALTGSENRLLKEMAEIRKSGNSHLSATEKAITDLALDLNDVTEKHNERLVIETHAIKDSLAKLDRTLRDLQSGDEAVLKKIQETRAGLDALGGTQQEQAKLVGDGFEKTLGRFDEQSQSLQKIISGDKQSLAQLKSSLTRIEDIVNRSAQSLVNDSHAQREKIESGLSDLRQRIDSRLDDDAKQYLLVLEKLADDWTETLRALHGEIDTKIQSAAEALLREVNELGHEIRSSGNQNEAIQKDLADELKRSAGLLDERFETLQDLTKKSTSAMESHVKVISADVGKLQSKQTDSLEILKEAIRANYDDNAERLKEAIRANYDDNAERLKETIDGAYDKFLNQVRAIPQALDRYSKFIESLHQNDRLALESLQKEMENILRMQADRFEEISSTTGGISKVFPLMDKKLEKQGQILEAMRRSQIDQDKDVKALKKGLAETRQESLNFNGDVKGELKSIENRTAQKFQEQSEMTSVTFEQLEKLRQSDLPAFRQELKNLLEIKFEFMESTATSRQTSWQADLFSRLEKERKISRGIFLLLGLLTVLTISIQVSLNFDTIVGMLP